MEANQILQIYGTEYKDNTIRLLKEADLASHIPSTECRIGIKPNLVSATPASFGATTHPEVVAGIIEYLQAHGCNNLCVLESAWVGDRTEACFEVCGYNDLSERYQVPLIDLQKDSSSTVDCKGMDLSICDQALSIDYLINVPVLKGHCQTRITCALKNMKGLIPNKEKRRFHSLGLHKPIGHLNARIRQDFIVVDHICGDLDFEDGGNPVTRNGILACCDPVLMDTFVCKKLHYELEEVPYIRIAESLGAGSTDLDSARIITLNNGSESMEDLPIPKMVVLVEDLVEEVESCSACYGYLIPALGRLKKRGLLEDFQGKICIGQGFRGKSGALGVGDCTCEFDQYVPGCPPTEDQIFEALKKIL